MGKKKQRKKMFDSVSLIIWFLALDFDFNCEIRENEEIKKKYGKTNAKENKNYFFKSERITKEIKKCSGRFYLKVS